VTGHTPGHPETLEYQSGSIYLPGPQGEAPVARMNRDSDSPISLPYRRDELCAEIVRRWNAHEDLLAACEALVDAEDERSACDSPEAAADVYRKIEAARAAIAKARGE
jgi:hypothetical protein